MRRPGPASATPSFSTANDVAFVGHVSEPSVVVCSVSLDSAFRSCQNTRVIRHVMAALAGFAALVTAPSALAYPPAHAPRSTDLRALGLSVEWPSRAAVVTVASGGRLTVGVRRVRASAPKVRLSLVRVTSVGKAIHLVDQQSVTAGRVTFVVPATPGVGYALRLSVNAKRFWSWIRVPALKRPPQAPPVPAPVNVPSDPQPSCPPTGTTDLALSVSPAVAPPGTNVTLSINNRGTACADFPSEYRFEKQAPDGTWFDASPHAFPADSNGLLPGAVITQPVTVWPDLAPGMYRIAKTVNHVAAVSSVPFTVQ